MFELICNSSGDNSNRLCIHNWVIYTPFRGDSYICCSKAGCMVTKSEFEHTLSSNSEYSNKVDTMYGMPYGEYGKLPVGAKVVDKTDPNKDNIVCPVVSDYNKARFNKRYGR